MSAAQAITRPIVVPRPGSPSQPGSASGQHQRINDTFIAATEKRVLRALAARLPAWVTPDQLTALGFVASLVILAGYALSNWSPMFLWLASFGFALNWFGDSLDGTLARFRKIERPKYGYFVDHSVDSVNMLLVAFGLGFSPYVRMELALLAIIGYLMMSILTYLMTHVQGVFRLSYGKLGPTEVRLLVVAVNTIVFVFGNPTLRIGSFSLGFFDGIALTAGIGLIVTFILGAARTARELSVVEPARS